MQIPAYPTIAPSSASFAVPIDAPDGRALFLEAVGDLAFITKEAEHALPVTAMIMAREITRYQLIASAELLLRRKPEDA